ncbi:MAG: protease modulator HflK [Pseudomonadota bacterium]
MRRLLLISAAIVLVVYAASGIYEVEPEESGVAYVLGRIVNPNVPSGIHWNLPAPFGREVTMPTRLTQVLQVGYGTATDSTTVISEPQDLWFTGGASIVEGRLDVQYRIDKLDRYLLAHDDPEAYMRLIAERAVTQFLAGLHVDDILTTKRQSLAIDVAQALQNGLDEYDMGIAVQDLSIVHLAPPLSGGVSDAFRKVQSARSEREREIENARSGASQIRFDAQAEAEAITSTAEADKFARVNQAQAAAERFIALAAEESTAPQITRTRLYRDIVPDALQRATLYVIPNDPSNGVTVEGR